MKEIPDGSVDMVLTDLPYATTQNAWDTLIPMDQLWAAWKRVCKPGAVIVLTTQQPFTTVVAASNLKQLRHEIIWRKAQGTGFLNANRAPLKSHENILIFCDRAPRYNPQKSFGHKNYKTGMGKKSSNYGSFDHVQTNCSDGSRYPTSVVEFNSQKGYHPTQKPTALLAYLIRTYTDPGMTVLDCTMGSGSTGVAALNEGRRFIGVEKSPEYFAMAEERIAAAQQLGLQETVCSTFQ